MRLVGRSASIVRGLWLLAQDADQGLQLGHAASEVEAVQRELLGLLTETFDSTGLVADQKAGDDRVAAVQDDGDSVVRPRGRDHGVAERVGAAGFTGDRDACRAAALCSVAHGVRQIGLGLHEDRHALGGRGLGGLVEAVPVGERTDEGDDGGDHHDDRDHDAEVGLLAGHVAPDVGLGVLVADVLGGCCHGLLPYFRFRMGV